MYVIYMYDVMYNCKWRKDLFVVISKSTFRTYINHHILGAVNHLSIIQWQTKHCYNSFDLYMGPHTVDTWHNLFWRKSPTSMRWGAAEHIYSISGANIKFIHCVTMVIHLAFSEIFKRKNGCVPFSLII